MKIDVTFISTKHYDKTNIGQWAWHFKKYTYIKGFMLRILGIYINVRENNATEKLIEIGKKRCQVN